MPLTTVDRLALFRDGSAALTATEAAGVNVLKLAPGTYKVWVSVPIAPTGTSPTCTITFQEAADGATWAAVNNDSISLVLNGAATAAQEVSGYLRVAKAANAGVTANVTAIPTVGGTNSPSFGKVMIGVVGAGAGTGGFNDAP